VVDYTQKKYFLWQERRKMNIRMDIFVRGACEEPFAPHAELNHEGKHQARIRRLELRKPKYDVVLSGLSGASIETSEILCGYEKDNLKATAEQLSIPATDTGHRLANVLKEKRNHAFRTCFRAYPVLMNSFVQYGINAINVMLQSYYQSHQEFPNRMLVISEPVIAVGIAARYMNDANIDSIILEDCQGVALNLIEDHPGMLQTIGCTVVR
jgi:hypothetical protein